MGSVIDSLNPDLRSVETFDGKVRKREFFRMSKEDAFKLIEPKFGSLMTRIAV